MHLEKFAADVVEVLSLREKTKKDYLSALNCHVFPQLGHKEITLITKSDIQQVVHELDIVILIMHHLALVPLLSLL